MIQNFLFAIPFFVENIISVSNMQLFYICPRASVDTIRGFDLPQPTWNWN